MYRKNKERMSVLKPILSTKNAHPRDSNLVFDEPTHVYTILTDPGYKYTSVTKWNHSHFPHFDADQVIRFMMSGKNWNPDNKYWGLTAKEIKDQWSQNGAAVSGAGTDLHFDIECFMNQELQVSLDYTHETLAENYKTLHPESPNKSDEWNYFLKYAQENPQFKPYRTEWMIYDEELKLAGSIDMVYENPDGTLSIYDWKRAKEIIQTNNFGKTATTKCVKHLPDTNYWHYSLQLNTYKAILEKQYGKKVTDLYLVRLHPNNAQQTYDLIKCADLSKEISELFDLKRKQMYPEPKITVPSNQETTETTEQEKTEQKQKQKITNQSSMLSFFKKSYQKTK